MFTLHILFTVTEHQFLTSVKIYLNVQNNWKDAWSSVIYGCSLFFFFFTVHCIFNSNNWWCISLSSVSHCASVLQFLWSVISIFLLLFLGCLIFSSSFISFTLIICMRQSLMTSISLVLHHTPCFIHLSLASCLSTYILLHLLWCALMLNQKDFLNFLLLHQ